MKKLTIALVAHDNRKAEMVEWAVHNAEFLSHHHIVCTGTTGNLVRKALEEKGVNADIACMHSGPRPTSRCCFASAVFITYLSLVTVIAPT